MPEHRHRRRGVVTNFGRGLARAYGESDGLGLGVFYMVLCVCGAAWWLWSVTGFWVDLALGCLSPPLALLGLYMGCLRSYAKRPHDRLDRYRRAEELLERWANDDHLAGLVERREDWQCAG